MKGSVLWQICASWYTGGEIETVLIEQFVGQLIDFLQLGFRADTPFDSHILALVTY